jgi:hypothetical protein
MHGSTWARGAYLLIPGALLTVIGTIFLCRFWIARRRGPSYGLFVVPVACACLAWVGSIIWEAWSRQDWDLLTASYWREVHGGFLVPAIVILIFGALNTLPAVAIAAYFEGREAMKGRDRN